jgi:tRNA U34 2-thiouridine synthase MnmA/TrmU
MQDLVKGLMDYSIGKVKELAISDSGGSLWYVNDYKRKKNNH